MSSAGITAQNLIRVLIAPASFLSVGINDNKMEDSQREAMFNAWKRKHDAEVKKCDCDTPNPRPTDKNNCFDCNGEIYEDYLDRVRWKKEA
jgi:hypothetical protein